MFVLSFLVLVIIAVAFSIIEVVLYEADRYGWAVVLLLAGGAGSYFLIDGVSTWVHTNSWQTMVEYAGFYLAAGAGVAAGKWIQYHFKFASQLKALKNSLVFYCDDAYSKTTPGSIANRKENIYGTDLTPDPVVISFDKTIVNHVQQVARAIRDASDSDYRYIKILARRVDIEGIKTMDDLINEISPAALSQVDRISAWIATWPFVILHTAFADIIMKFGKHVARLIDAVFGRLTKAIVARAFN